VVTSDYSYHYRVEAMPLVRPLVWVAMLFLSFSWTGSVHAQAHAPYRIVDSGFPAEDFYPTTWIDDEQVLFTAVKLGTYLCDVKDSLHCGGRGHLLAVSVWDVRQNKVTTYKDRILSDVCIHNGYISYKAREHLSEQEGSVFAGKFGFEKKLGLMSEYKYNNPTSCRYYRQPWLPPEARGRRISFLLEEHGFVDFGPSDPAKLTPEGRNAPPILRSLDGKKAIPLDIEKRYRMNGWLRFTYLPFSNEYFAQGDTTNISEIVPAFFVSRTGVVRKVDVPDGAWKGPMYHAVRPGLFISTWNRRDKDFPNASGGYLLTSGKVVTVVAGALRSPSVSPNGCKVAFIYASSPDAISDGYRAWRTGKPGNTIRMIDVCEGDKK
jgi:hypothetical protein